MADNYKKIIFGVVVILVIAAIVIIQNPFKQPENIAGELKNNENTGLDIGNQAPDFILKSLEGDNVQLSSFRNKKAVVVNFWATWCPPCREEMPAFQEIFENNKDKLTILGVDLQESEEAIQKFLLDIPVTYPLLLDPDAEVKELYNVFTQPVTYFIDGSGIITDKKFGPLIPQEIEDKFGKLGIQ